MTEKEQNLSNALSDFITAIRRFLSNELSTAYGEDWERIYFDTLNDHHKTLWGERRMQGDDISQLIDFGNLSGFAIKTKFFHQALIRGAGSFPTKFLDITQARNMLAHYSSWDQDKADLGFAQMIDIAKKLEMTDLEFKLRSYKKGDSSTLNVSSKPSIQLSNLHNHHKSKSFKKKDAIELVNSDLGRSKLNNSNTVFSNINKNGAFWWLNITPEKFNSRLNIILVENSELIWISNLSDRVCANYKQYFNTRADNGKIDLYIGAVEGNAYLKETRKGKDFNFSPMIVKRIPIAS